MSSQSANEKYYIIKNDKNILVKQKNENEHSEDLEIFESAALNEGSISHLSPSALIDENSLPMMQEKNMYHTNVGIEILESDAEDDEIIAISLQNFVKEMASGNIEDCPASDSNETDPAGLNIAFLCSAENLASCGLCSSGSEGSISHLSPSALNDENVILVRESLPMMQEKNMYHTNVGIDAEDDETFAISRNNTVTSDDNEIIELSPQSRIVPVKQFKRMVQPKIFQPKPSVLKIRQQNTCNVVDLKNQQKKSLKEEEKLLETMKNNMPSTSQQLSWETIQETVNRVQPASFGRRVHGSIERCPASDICETDPAGLNVALMPHQQHALAWLLWRETQTPPGGLLVDDMGLGKTLIMISLIIKKREMVENEHNVPSDEDSNSSREKYYGGGTLVVCPVNLINQWESDVQTKCKKNLLTVNLYHGSNRKLEDKRLAKYAIVITTYNIGMTEFKKKGPLFKIKWDRIILDESHTIRNHKSQTAEAMFALRGRNRWAITGTPIHNNEMHMFSVLKFLKCSPFDDLQIWKKWVGSTSPGGQERLHMVVKSIMLRRTKDQLQADGALMSLPEKNSVVVEIVLNKEEMQVYQKTLVISKALFAKFLHQYAEKNTEFAYDSDFMRNSDKNQEYVKMHKKLMQVYGATEVKRHDVLVLLLRLRQICNHPCLIKDMIHRDNYETGDIEDDNGNDIDLLEYLRKLNIDEEEVQENDAGPSTSEDNNLNNATRKILNPDNALFNENVPSSKIKKILDILNSQVLDNSTDKAVVVSQWTGMLRILRKHLNNNGIECMTLSRDIPVYKRMPIIDDFNNPDGRFRVLLLLLKAGGVGLNLVGANHLLLIEPNWNPQLETQVLDIIYRMGQKKKTVKIYKFISIDTIEQRIKHLQEQKTIGSAKLTIEDTCMIFNM